MTLDKNIEIFVIHVIFFSLSLILIYLTKIIYIILLFIKKIKILVRYLDFSNVFSKKNALILLKIIKLNQYFIKL